MAAQPLFIALRFHLLGGKKLGPDSILESGVQALWEKALELGLIIELHMDSTFALPVANMLRTNPESTVVIDHLAEAGFKDGTPVEFANLLDLAAFDKVYMKLSGLNHFAKDAPYYLSARPFTRRVIAEFGPDQLVWGSGVQGIVDAHMPEYSETDLMKVKGGNLQRLHCGDLAGCQPGELLEAEGPDGIGRQSGDGPRADGRRIARGRVPCLPAGRRQWPARDQYNRRSFHGGTPET